MLGGSVGGWVGEYVLVRMCVLCVVWCLCVGVCVFVYVIVWVSLKIKWSSTAPSSKANDGTPDNTVVVVVSVVACFTCELASEKCFSTSRSVLDPS